jgi:hypothetical protein
LIVIILIGRLNQNVYVNNNLMTIKYLKYADVMMMIIKENLINCIVIVKIAIIMILESVNVGDNLHYLFVIVVKMIKKINFKKNVIVLSKMN